MPITDKQIEKMLKQAVWDSVITCPKCGATMEPDALECPSCKLQNPLIVNGYI